MHYRRKKHVVNVVGSPFTHSLIRIRTLRLNICIIFFCLSLMNIIYFECRAAHIHTHAQTHQSQIFSIVIFMQCFFVLFGCFFWRVYSTTPIFRARAHRHSFSVVPLFQHLNALFFTCHLVRPNFWSYYATCFGLERCVNLNGNK